MQHIKVIISIFVLRTLTANAALTVGVEFAVAFPCVKWGWIAPAQQFLSITNGNAIAAQLSIFSSDPHFRPIHKLVFAQSTDRIAISNTRYQICIQDEIYRRNGFLIQSSVPVSLYVDMESTTGVFYTSFLVLPTAMLGTQYPMDWLIASVLIAVQDNTQITIGKRTIRLNALEAIRVAASGNLTSNNRIAFINSIPADLKPVQNTAFMALPSIYKATEFPIIPHPNVSSTNVIVYAFEDNTDVRINGVSQGIIGAGGVMDITVTQPSIISTSRKVQLITGNTHAEQLAALVVPSDFFINSNRVVFHPMGHTSYFKSGIYPTHTMVLITTQASTGQIALDNVFIPSREYKRISSSSYYYALFTVSYDQHVITSNVTNVKYAASVYTSFYGTLWPNALLNVGLDLPESVARHESVLDKLPRLILYVFLLISPVASFI